jgi:hypothetical protein
MLVAKVAGLAMLSTALALLPTTRLEMCDEDY